MKPLKMTEMKLCNGTLLTTLIRENNLGTLFIELAKENQCNIWLVGGLIRDVLQNKTPQFIDFDLVVKPGVFSLPISQKIAHHLGCNYFVLDENRGTYRISQPNFQIDINAIRGNELIDDLFLRDFSFNAICISCSAISESLITGNPMIPFEDYFSGTNDIANQRVRAQNPGSFVDDPLRILRAFRFASLNHWTIDEQTYEEMILAREYLSRVSSERIRDELCMILSSPKSSLSISAMDLASILEVFFPFLPLFKEMDQTYTTKLQVKRHTLATLEYLEQILARIQNQTFPYSEILCPILSSTLSGDRTVTVLLKIASLLHDIGKPDTLSEEEDRLRFFNHEIHGSDMACEWLEKMKFSTVETLWFRKIISHHMRPHNLSNAEKLTPRAKYRYFREGEDVSIPLLLLALADAYATKMVGMGELKEYENFVTDMLHFYSIPELVKPIPFLNGDDVMNILNLPPSRTIGVLLEELLELQSLGQINTKEEALEFLKNKKL